MKDEKARREERKDAYCLLRKFFVQCSVSSLPARLSSSPLKIDPPHALALPAGGQHNEAGREKFLSSFFPPIPPSPFEPACREERREGTLRVLPAISTRDSLLLSAGIRGGERGGGEEGLSKLPPPDDTPTSYAHSQLLFFPSPPAPHSFHPHRRHLIAGQGGGGGGGTLHHQSPGMRGGWLVWATETSYGESGNALHPPGGGSAPPPPTTLYAAHTRVPLREENIER